MRGKSVYLPKKPVKKSAWYKHHKWTGLILCFFMLMFCLSGIILNHRGAVRRASVSRALLPPFYRYSCWNGGLMRGAMAIDDGSRLIYGSGGVWRARGSAPQMEIDDFNGGLPVWADCRSVRAMERMPDGRIFALSAYGLYSLDGDSLWRRVEVPVAADEALADVTSRGDTLVVVSRSRVFLATEPFERFTAVELAAPAGPRRGTTLFRSLWRLHSGERFGLAGRLVADAVAAALIFLCLTGFTGWLLPKFRKRLGARIKKPLLFCKNWHNHIGRATIPLTLIVVITGWCLRPPLMIPLVTLSTGSDGDHPQGAWSDKLRMLRHDAAAGDWLLSTSDGFFSLKNLADTPVKIDNAPPVSVMGLTVWQPDGDGRWICGSLGGMSRWDRTTGKVTDYFTGDPVKPGAGKPFGSRAVSGFSAQLGPEPVVVEYDRGTDAVAQPDSLATLPMPLWNVALEVHTGRIYFGNSATYFFTFLAGAAAVWCVWSGFKLRKGKRKSRPRTGRGFSGRRGGPLGRAGRKPAEDTD